VFLGAATLTRPVGVLLPFFAVLMIFLEAKSDLKFKIRSSLLFLAIFGLILTPWLARNYKHFGQIIVSSLPAYNWYMYNAREFYALKNNLGKEEAKAIFQTKARAIRPTNISHDQVFLGKFYWEESWTIIRESPLAYASLHAVNTLAVFFSGGIEEIRSVFTGKASGANFTRSIWKGPKEIFLLLQNYPLEVLGKLGLLIFYAVVGYGWIRSRSMAQGKIFTLFLLLVLYFGLTTGAVAEPRFRVPAQPFIFLLFSVSFFSLFFPGKAAKISGSPGGLNGSVKLAFRQ
ncbi:MAG: hypothetical protein HY397_01505, partial [Candidatus Doudnabacteria bacterium]|nr:hypothetical protein [Candidatus Doudnabacteria bacterium]